MVRAIALLLVLPCAVWLHVAPVMAQEPALPDAFTGHWEGTGAQRNPTAEWPVTLTLTGGHPGDVVGTIDYPTLACGGELTLQSADTSAASVELAEDLTFGEAVCADGGIVHLAILSDGSLDFQWSHPAIDSPAAGTLNRIGVRPIALQIPALNIDAAVEARDIVAGSMEEPTNPRVAAWYRQTGWLGAPGNATMYGYPDWVGIGPVVFYRLGDLREEDQITVLGADCLAYAFEVVSIEFYDTAAAPLDRIFASVSDAELLTLFSYTEPYDPVTDQYERVVVVQAERTADGPTPVQDASAATPAPGDCADAVIAVRSSADAIAGVVQRLHERATAAFRSADADKHPSRDLPEPKFVGNSL